MPDDNSAQNQGEQYREGFGRSVDNNCLNNHKLTTLLSLRLYQRTELWVVPDGDSAKKMGWKIGGDSGDNNCLNNQKSETIRTDRTVGKLAI